MPRTHIIATTYTPDEEDAEEIELLIYYTYTPGQPERGPTYACGGTPAEPAEVELDHVDFADGTPAPEFEEWSARYLQQAGYDHARERADEDLMPDPDAAREARRDWESERRNWTMGDC